MHCPVLPCIAQHRPIARHGLALLAPPSWPSPPRLFSLAAVAAACGVSSAAKRRAKTLQGEAAKQRGPRNRMQGWRLVVLVYLADLAGLAGLAGLVVHAFHFDLFLIDLLWDQILALDLQDQSPS